MLHRFTLSLLVQGLALLLLGPACEASSLGLTVHVVPLDSNGGTMVGNVSLHYSHSVQVQTLQHWHTHIITHFYSRISGTNCFLGVQYLRQSYELIQTGGSFVE